MSISMLTSEYIEDSISKIDSCYDLEKGVIGDIPIQEYLCQKRCTCGYLIWERVRSAVRVDI